MNFFITLLTVLEVIVCLLLSLLVLMQRPRQEGLGAAFGSGVTDQMFGAQTTNVLQKATVYLGVALFGLTFLLAILVSRQDDRATGKATFVEPTDKVAKPVAGKDGLPSGMSEESIRKMIEQKVGEKAAEGKTSTPPAPGTPPAPAAPAESKTGTPAPASAADKPAAPAPIPAAPAPATPAPAPAAPAADKPAVPAPIPAPATSSPIPAAPVPAAPAPAK